MTRDEESRLIAEWLGWTIRRHGEYVNLSGPDGTLLLTVWGPNEVADESINEKLPDFRTSEEANALILEKFTEPELWVESSKGAPKLWACVPDMTQEHPDKNPAYVCTYNHDRKSAIVEAALALIAAGETK